MTVAQLISHLRECDQEATVEVLVEDAYVAAGPGYRNARGVAFSLTTGARDGAEILIVNAR